jgi:hypothetical protein
MASLTSSCKDSADGSPSVGMISLATRHDPIPLPPDGRKGCAWVTLGCPIGENVAGVDYQQYLGLFDARGQVNAWGHWPIIGR